ncbi:hypothetical protein TI39_contig268g00002 [Zymoseptoria brevis]|uniref:F-box domain-containing protein n=1 Tax=Zymoseptoria brevis TaxID=1047168 RepID=A0A0F4H0H3_9PEZI|nr:hypothetical protein TI39_contig268g00002 [Zymoseptoria brevis]
MSNLTVGGGLHFNIMEEQELKFAVASRPSSSSNDTPSQPANIMTVPKAAQQPFGLLDLPDELWSRIGKMVIEDLSPNLFSSDDRPETPSIFQTCSALRRELRLTYFATKIKISLNETRKSQSHSRKREALGDYFKMIGPLAARQIIATYRSKWYDKDCFSDKHEAAYMRKAQTDLEAWGFWIGYDIEVSSKRVKFLLDLLEIPCE